MGDLIERRAAIDALAEHEKSRGHNYTLFVDIVSECAEIIRNLPSAQPTKINTLETLDCVSRQAERKKGRWIEYPDCLRYDGAYSDDHIVCSECEYVFSICDNCTEEFDFCPHCGADMRGEKDE